MKRQRLKRPDEITQADIQNVSEIFKAIKTAMPALQSVFINDIKGMRIVKMGELMETSISIEEDV